MYVKDYDPTAHGGRGELAVTPKKVYARRFPERTAAIQYYRQSAGIRPDGKPNRPLTAWTVDIQPFELLSIWTVYDHPNTVAARRQEIDAGEIVHTDDMIIGPDLASVRQQLKQRGLTVLPRQPGDNPVIVESWI